MLTLLREHLPDAKYMVELPDGQRLYTDFIDDWNLSAAHACRSRSSCGCRSRASSWSHPVTRRGGLLDLVEEIGLNDVSYAIGWTAWLDIAPQGVDKGTALELVREWLGIDPAHVLVIGDGRNDLGMFRWALENGGRAIAMAQGPQEVLDAASETTASVQEGGVAAALRALSRPLTRGTQRLPRRPWKNG